MSGGDPAGISQPDPTLREVASYRLLRRIGEGGMSSVFLSYDIANGHPVAVKVLADHLAHSREFVTRFYREARLSRLLSHPNIVRGLAAGYDPAAAKHYLILEFVDGPTAHTALARSGRFSVGSAARVGVDIARALEFLHSRQYIHRDVKPDNVLLHPGGGAKLADLGLAKRLNDDPQLTALTQGVGTSYYMAYEQALNANLVDGRSDIFALGATLYHLLTGEVPFPGATHEEVVRVKGNDSFRPIRELNPDVPVEFAAIISATLARDPRARIQTAVALADALESTRLATFISPQQCEDEPTLECGPGGSPTRADLGVPVLPTTPDHSQESPGPGTPRTSLLPVEGSVYRRIVLGLCVASGLAALAIGGVYAASVWAGTANPLPVPSIPTPTADEVEESFQPVPSAPYQ